MDELAGLLDGPRARGAFLLRAQLAPPWSMRIQDEAPLTLVAVLRGSAWVCFDDGSTRKLTAGDVAVLRGPDPYTFCDHPDTTPQVVVGPEQVCTTPAGQEVVMTGLGLRTWGNDPHGPTTLLVGTYQLRGEVSRRLLGALPVLVVVAVPDSPVMTLLGAEISRDEPGQEAVLDRLLDLLLIDVLRSGSPAPNPARGTAPTPIRSLAGRCACCSTARNTRGRSPRSPPRPACPAPRWPAGSPNWSASRRWPTSPAGGSRSPRTCCGTRTPPSLPSPAASATPARSRSAPRSNELTG
ncbi:hypothetical protein GCM10022380_80340 [Amycolatopsis tucumanensis]|uniref:AraC-type transcription regulator ligand-binding domain-containing protein n=1 Tax=Amycolatopsis tucumanensis TaxID=401106 RepID=A0ABP7JP34_9PSEU